MNDFLNTPLMRFSSVGIKRNESLEKLGFFTVENLLEFYPRRYEDRRVLTPLAALAEGSYANVVASVQRLSVSGNRFARRSAGPRCVTTSIIEDATGTLRVVWFNRFGVEKTLSPGVYAHFWGRVVRNEGGLQLVNPDFELLEGDERSLPAGALRIEPIYPSAAGLPEKWFRRFIGERVSEAAACLSERLPPFLLERYGLISLGDAVLGMHRPNDEMHYKEARKRLLYEELLALQLHWARARSARERSARTRAFCFGDEAMERTVSRCSFALSASQLRAIGEITADLRRDVPMNRLLHGDVGSGKTCVALVAVGIAVACGFQAAFLAPTEVLAAQLFAEGEKLLGAEVCALLTGTSKAGERKELFSRLASGEPRAVFGTHALLQDRVAFARLGLVVIDEQHRFGVKQRSALLEKSDPPPHLLTMSATPIPRTQCIALYGDLDVSVLPETLPGRMPVATRLVDMKDYVRVVRFVRSEAAHDGRTFWVCPLIDESKEGARARASALTRYAALRRQCSDLGVELLHGKLSPQEKSDAMERFRSGRSKLLISTTVVEVGVDVPEASLIVIESPSVFGLSQLHQLRGRVGRSGRRRGVCLLLESTEALSDAETRKRLEVLLETNDGFAVADADMRLRGPGLLAGIRQHGKSEFRLANPLRDVRWLLRARRDAREWIARDPELMSSKAFADYMNRLLSRIEQIEV